MDIEEFKCSVSRILTSSKDPICIEEFRKIFRKKERMNVPFRNLGYNSVIELLQSIPDVLTLPENPDSSSIMCAIITEKNEHLLESVIIKGNSKSRKQHFKGRSGWVGKYRKKTKCFKATTLSYDDYINYKQHGDCNFDDYNFDNYNFDNNQPSTSNSRIDNNKKTLNQNDAHCFDNVMDKLRANLDLKKSENQQHATKNKMTISHEDYLALKIEIENEVLNELEHSLSNLGLINNKAIVLKNKGQKKTED